jgi:hypothetical protein
MRVICTPLGASSEAISSTIFFTSLFLYKASTTYTPKSGASNVTGTLTTGIKISVNSKEKIDHVIVIETVVRDKFKRIVLPVAKIKEMAEITYVDGEPVGYEVTVQALPDASGNTHYEYIGGTSL